MSSSDQQKKKTSSSKIPPPKNANKEKNFPSGEIPPLRDLLEEVEVKPSKLSLFLRKILRWTVAVMVVFALGVGAAWSARIQPQRDEIEQLKNDIVSEQDRNQSLEAKIKELNPLIEANAALSGQLADAEMQADVLMLIMDVNSAQLALIENDSVTAKAALSGSDSRLGDLQQEFTGESSQTVAEMRVRLVLVLDEIDDDFFAALRDLEILSNNLQALSRSLFGE